MNAYEDDRGANPSVTGDVSTETAGGCVNDIERPATPGNGAAGEGNGGGG